MHKIVPLDEFDFEIDIEKEAEDRAKSLGEVKRMFLANYKKSQQVADACHKSGLLMSQFREALLDDDLFRKKFEHLQELAIDKVENHLMKFIDIEPVIETEEGYVGAHPLAKESLKATEVYLKAKAKHRGYGVGDYKQIDEAKDNKVEIIVVQNENKE